MTIQMFQGDLERLSDEELRTLENELSESLTEDPWFYPEGSWERQADERHTQIIQEIDRRWRAANPEEAARRDRERRPYLEIVQAQLERVRPEMQRMFEKSDQISRLIRRG